MSTRSSRFAVVTSSLALVVALGGTSYAASQIGTAQIKNNAITSPKIKDGSVLGADVKDGGVTSADVLDNSLTGADVTESSLGQVPSAADALNAQQAGHADTADTADQAGYANSAGDADTVNGATIVRINYRGGDATNAFVASLNGFTLRVSCTAGTEHLTAVTTVADGEVGVVSQEPDNLANPAGAILDSFGPGVVFDLGPSVGSASDRQFSIGYSAGDGRSVNGVVTTEDSIGSSNCVVSGYLIG